MELGSGEIVGEEDDGAGVVVLARAYLGLGLNMPARDRVSIGFYGARVVVCARDGEADATCGGDVLLMGGDDGDDDVPDGVLVAGDKEADAGKGDVG